QRCHTGHCPTGVTAQAPWLVRGLDPTLKSVRCANYIMTLRKELLQLSRACGRPHPALIGREQVEVLEGGFQSRPVAEIFGYAPGWGMLAPDLQQEIRAVMGALERLPAAAD
ncbi:MAG TPA: glutamate synthase-related protein, partial [bacterium]|nr:glutamate synthase-related protein [bacterium]